MISSPPGGPAPDPGVTVTWLGHATVLFEIGGLRILTDPVLRGRVAFLRRVGAGPPPAKTPPVVDVVLLSHLHHDHCDLPSLRLLGPQVRIVAPVGAGSWLRDKGFRNVTELAQARTLELGNATVTAVPAEHDGFRMPFGPRAAAVGYLVDGAGRRCYFAGDTDLFDAMRDLGAADGGLDLALLPVWGWGTSLGPGHLDPSSAAAAVDLLAPRLSIPVHWGTLLPASFRSLHPHAVRMLHVPPASFAAEVRSAGSGNAVLVAEPGRPVRIGP